MTFLQRATSATSNEQFLQQVTSDFLQRATSATSNEWILQRVTSNFLKQATSATSNEQILQRVTSDFTTGIEQRVGDYVTSDNLNVFLEITAPRILIQFKIYKSSLPETPEEFLCEIVLKICSIFTGEHPP